MRVATKFGFIAFLLVVYSLVKAEEVCVQVTSDRLASGLTIVHCERSVHLGWCEETQLFVGSAGLEALLSLSSKGVGGVSIVQHENNLMIVPYFREQTHKVSRPFHIGRVGSSRTNVLCHQSTDMPLLLKAGLLEQVADTVNCFTSVSLEWLFDPRYFSEYSQLSCQSHLAADLVSLESAPAANGVEAIYHPLSSALEVGENLLYLKEFTTAQDCQLELVVYEDIEADLQAGELSRMTENKSDLELPEVDILPPAEDPVSRVDASLNGFPPDDGSGGNGSPVERMRVRIIETESFNSVLYWPEKIGILVAAGSGSASGKREKSGKDSSSRGNTWVAKRWNERPSWLGGHKTKDSGGKGGGKGGDREGDEDKKKEQPSKRKLDDLTDEEKKRALESLLDDLDHIRDGTFQAVKRARGDAGLVTTEVHDLDDHARRSSMAAERRQGLAAAGVSATEGEMTDDVLELDSEVTLTQDLYDAAEKIATGREKLDVLLQERITKNQREFSEMSDSNSWMKLSRERLRDYLRQCSLEDVLEYIETVEQFNHEHGEGFNDALATLDASRAAASDRAAKINPKKAAEGFIDSIKKSLSDAPTAEDYMKHSKEKMVAQWENEKYYAAYAYWAGVVQPLRRMTAGVSNALNQVAFAKKAESHQRAADNWRELAHTTKFKALTVASSQLQTIRQRHQSGFSKARKYFLESSNIYSAGQWTTNVVIIPAALLAAGYALLSVFGQADSDRSESECQNGKPLPIKD